MEERLVCKSCLIEEQRSSKDFIQMEEARIVINSYTKKIERILNPYLNEIQRKFQSIEQYIDKQKSNLNNLLNQIIKDVQKWQESLISVTWINKNEKDFLNIFDNIKRNDEDWLKDSELKITYEIQQLGYTYYHKIDKQLKQYADQLMNFKLADKVIEIAKLSQEKCWNVYIDNSFIKKKQLEQKFKLIYCPEHNKIVETINIEKNVPKSRRISCQECQQSGLDIEQFIKILDQKQYQKLEQQQNAQIYMQECYKNSLSKLEQLRNAQYKNLTNMIDSVYLKIVDGSNCFQQIYLQSDDFSIVKFQEMAEMCSQEQQKCELQTIPQFRLLLYKQGQAMVQDVRQILIDSRQEDGDEQKKNKVSIKVEREQINKNQSQLQQLESLTGQSILRPYQADIQEIYSMAFNRNGFLLLTGGDDMITVYLFLEGRIETLRRIPCQRSVSVLLFGQQSNDFISGHSDGSLQIWNYLNQINYTSTIFENQHMETLRCLIINKKQDQLISSSDDQTIIVHQLSFKQKSLLLKQSLTKHQDNVTSICLNQSETTLLSCSKDAQIIVWKKNNYDDWEFKNIVNHSVKQYGNKIVFIKDNQFIWTQYKEQKILVFEEANQVFIQKSKSSIINEIKQDVKIPFIYNLQFNQIICHHGQNINLVKQLQDGSFQIVSSFQNQPTGQYKGVVTNDFKYLVIWNKKLYQLKIYQLYI
ncbi:unnamed protein product [Paramecium pentaurelia]|uniref:WD40-repeat-containing domain n=1 Tax=Paramecium pentaurelia TaxID=43138 RepID=A0A8S1Y002_9CILI|nr:unnamed protein product [Paramecium pentaurelia]